MSVFILVTGSAPPSTSGMSMIVPGLLALMSTSASDVSVPVPRSSTSPSLLFVSGVFVPMSGS